MRFFSAIRILYSASVLSVHGCGGNLDGERPTVAMETWLEAEHDKHEHHPFLPSENLSHPCGTHSHNAHAACRCGNYDGASPDLFRALQPGKHGIGRGLPGCKARN